MRKIKINPRTSFVIFWARFLVADSGSILSVPSGFAHAFGVI